jgi:hypothetical protein
MRVDNLDEQPPIPSLEAPSKGVAKKKKPKATLGKLLQPVGRTPKGYPTLEMVKSGREMNALDLIR